ncbi:MAG: tRNA (guanosine(37)-N1)-methyltransferase TrmD [Candidatus Zambryskibacteria bacterium]|nr:tRNA (guanosine(37)-N1)-methyltransferase TrmD [Candidatus Zambryskibacteria bacterium]
MVFHIITLFPEIFNSYLNESILGRAIKNKKIKIKFYNPRDFVTSSQKQNLHGVKKPYLRVDDKPYGGGPGMILQAKPIIKAIEKALRQARDKQKVKVIWLSPSGEQLDNIYAEKIKKKYKDIIIICGRYEGIDERVRKIFKAESVSVGPFILTGGELPAMIIIDTIARRIPGILGKNESIEENREASSKVYTRPEILKYKGKNYRVPKVLLSGNHKKIEEWRKRQK